MPLLSPSFSFLFSPFPFQTETLDCMPLWAVGGAGQPGRGQRRARTTWISCYIFIFFKLKILFIQREGKGRRKRGRETSMCGCLLCPPLGTWPVTKACALTGDRTSNPLVCRLMLNPQSHTSQGSFYFFTPCDVVSLELLSASWTLPLSPGSQLRTARSPSTKVGEGQAPAPPTPILGVLFASMGVGVPTLCFVKICGALSRLPRLWRPQRLLCI